MGFLSAKNDYQAQLPGQRAQRVQPGGMISQSMADEMNKQIDAQAGPEITQTNFAPQIDAAQSAALPQYNMGPNPNIDTSGSSAVSSQQQALAQALQAQAQGQGPNPAQEAFKRNSEASVAQNAGMMASQKGINPALQDRMIAQNAAHQGQAAAGEAAQMQAQQQIAAQGQLGGLLAQQRQQELEQQQNILRRQQLAQEQQNAQYGFQNQARGMQNQYIGTLLGAQQGQNALNANTSLGVQGINSGISQSNTAAQNQLTGGLLNAAGGIGASFAGKAHGGKIAGNAKVSGDSPENDTVPAMLSPGEIVIPRSKADDPEKAKEFIEHLKGMKSKPKVDSYGKVLEAHRKMKTLMAEMEKHLGGKVK